jgi:hypothetical protein
MKRQYMILLAAACIYIVGTGVSLACTGFVAVKDGQVLAGQNVDWKNPNLYAWFLPPENGKYGCFFFGMLPGYPTGGVNDQGLVQVGAGTSTVKLKPLPGQKNVKSLRQMLKLFQEAMRTCATVDEALEWYRKYSLKTAVSHNIIMDRTGKWVLLEADKKGNLLVYPQGDTRFYYLDEALNRGEGENPPPLPDTLRHSPHFQVVTNFLHTDPKRKGLFGPYPCWRYDTTVKMLENAEKISVDLFRSILEAVHQDGDYPTKRSVIYDVKNGDVYFSYLGNFEKEIKFNLNTELKKGKKVYDLRSLFGLRLHPRFLLAAVVFLSPLILWPLVFLVRRIRQKRTNIPAGPVEKRKSALAARVTAAVNGLLFFVVIYEYPYILSHLLPLVKNNLYVNFYVFYGKLFMVNLVFTLLMLIFTVFAWKKQYWAPGFRIHYSLVTLVSLGVIGIMLL